MARILCVDYGLRRAGIAVTDTLQIAVHPLRWIETSDLYDFLNSYMEEEEVEEIVFGDARHHDGQASQVTEAIMDFAGRLQKKHPHLSISLVDEAYTSARAKELILQSGAKKKTRKQKGNIDKISAVLILQKHLGHI